MVRTLPFHGKNAGSNPVRDILFYKNNNEIISIIWKRGDSNP